MSTHTNSSRGGIAGRSWLLLVAVALIALASVAQTSAGTAAVDAKPVIGKPVTVPAQPVAGKRFTVSFRVTRSDTGAPVKQGTMICDPSVTGRVIAHTESFTGGIARLGFVVPTSAAGKLLKVKVAIKTAGESATRVAAFKVLGAQTPMISIAGSSIAEGSSGTTVLSFPVTLSAAVTQSVTVSYATADGSAVAPADYAATSGTLTFAPGQKAKAITVSVVGDTAMEQDETLTVALASPVNATIGIGVATGTITNDDTAVPVTPGNYKGATQNGDYVFFTVTANRTVTGFRMNAVAEQCSPSGTLRGSIDWTDTTIMIRADGSFAAEGSWTGSDVQGDYEWLKWSASLTGVFTNATSVTGKVVISDELKYQGNHYACSTGELTWSATLQS